MSRLAEYMANLAAFYGYQENVHFKELVEGSTGLRTIIEYEAEPKIRDRIKLVRSNDGPKDARKAFESINRMLRDDNGDAVIMDNESVNVIHFPGVEERAEPPFGPITQPGSIDGVIIRIGGKKEKVPVLVQTRDGFEANCKVKRSLARELAPFLFNDELRLSGNGKWIRDEDGTWNLDSFNITGYEKLTEKSLREVTFELRQIKHSGWGELEDPWEELDKIRGDE